DRWGPSLPKGWTRLFVWWSFGISYVFLALQQVPKGDMESMALSAASALLLVSLDRKGGLTLVPLRSFAAGLGIGLAPLLNFHAVVRTWLGDVFSSDLFADAIPFAVCRPNDGHCFACLDEHGRGAIWGETKNLERARWNFRSRYLCLRRNLRAAVSTGFALVR